MAEADKFETYLISMTETYVKRFMADKLDEKMCYHNLNHTLEVVEAAEIIGRGCKLNEDELEQVIIAAWFHDIGYYNGREDHELHSADLARSFLIKTSFPAYKIENVCSSILATKIPQSPKNLLEQVLCDADLYHLSTEKFFEKTELLREEMLAHKIYVQPESWLSTSCNFVTNHKYFTEYARTFLRPKKIKNLSALKRKINSWISNK